MRCAASPPLHPQSGPFRAIREASLECVASTGRTLDGAPDASAAGDEVTSRDDAEVGGAGDDARMGALECAEREDAGCGGAGGIEEPERPPARDQRANGESATGRGDDELELGDFVAHEGEQREAVIDGALVGGEELEPVAETAQVGRDPTRDTDETVFVVSEWEHGGDLELDVAAGEHAGESSSGG